MKTDDNGTMSVMSPSMPQANEIMAKATMAAAVFNQLDQAHVDRIVEAVYKAGFNARVRLAKMAAEETGLGVWQHKVLKNVLGTQLVYESIRNEKTVGILSHDERSGITEIAQPLGPIFAIIPVTNPTSTAMFKILISLKTRNPIIISPARRALKCCAEAARISYEAALRADAPEDCIQWLAESSRDLTQAIMGHPKLALILATGGGGLVKAAYSSGTPAIGVGPGNVPVFIDRSADFAYAVRSIVASKTFDNGTICASEQAVIVEQACADAVVRAFEAQQCYFLPPEDIKKIEAIAVDTESGTMNPKIVGQPVEKIARMAGIAVPAGTCILMARQDQVGRRYPLSGEILAPILAFYVRPDYESACKLCIDLNYLGGVGHTASIYANDGRRIQAFAEMMNAGRVVVNTPSSQGAVGGTYNALPVSFTLGCGSGGKNITTENITARHLINVKRLCRPHRNERWFAFDAAKFMDESLDADAVAGAYNLNF